MCSRWCQTLIEFCACTLVFEISKGAEAAVHAARMYLDQLPSENVLLKLDFRNAFNGLSRGEMFRAVQGPAPGGCNKETPLAHCCFA